MKNFILILTLLFFVKANAQSNLIKSSNNKTYLPKSDISVGMGVGFANVSSLKNYINAKYTGSDKMGTFITSANFWGKYVFEISNNYEIGVELGYSIYSYSMDVFTQKYEISYSAINPSALIFYKYQQEAYKIRAGAGLGLRIFSLNEKFSSIIDDDYDVIGAGFLFRAEGLTLLSDNLFALIGVDAGYDFSGKLENDGKTLHNSYDNEDVNMSTFYVGIKLGVAYFF